MSHGHDDVFSKCENLGEAKVREMRITNQFHSLEWAGVDAWLKLKESEAKDRADKRSEESLSISRKALRNSTWAAIIAIIAIIFSARSKLIELLRYVFGL